MNINRIIETQIKAKTGKGKTIIVVGPRQVGKTTLIKKIISNEDHLFLDGDDPTIRNLLANANTEQLKSIIGTYKTVLRCG